MTNLPKPLDMSDTEILDWFIDNHRSIFHCDYPEYWLYASEGKQIFQGNFRKVVRQAAAILKENENG